MTFIIAIIIFTIACLIWMYIVRNSSENKAKEDEIYRKELARKRGKQLSARNNVTD